MPSNNNMNIIIDLANDLFEKNCDIHDEMRGCSLAYSVYHPRTLFLFSSKCNKNYAMRV